MDKFLKACFYAISLYFLFIQVCSAQTIIVPPNTVISEPKLYSNLTLDLSKGNFILRNNATLTIRNCIVNGTLSPTNPILFTLEKGNVNFVNSTFNIKSVNIAQHPLTQSLEYVVQVAQGTVSMSKNNFYIDTPLTAGLLITTSSQPTANFVILQNIFQNFHGVLYLINTNNSVIADNIFLKNSYGHMVIIGNNIQVLRNKVFFSGDDHLGNAIDVIDSNTVTISKNEIYTPTCHAMYILSSQNLVIDGNRIYGGITYGLNILTYAEALSAHEPVTTMLGNYKVKNTVSNNITVTNNYMSQNRFGLAASDVDNLSVKNNYFSQRFTDDASRKFWTDNNVLLKNVTNLTWSGNLYREAFSQDPNGDNSKSFNFVTFPETGGITL